MAKTLLGLDIGTNLIKAIHLSIEKDGNSLLSAGFIPNSRSIANSSKNDEQTIANGINRMIHDMKVSTLEVSAALSSFNVLTRVIDVPIMNDRDLDSSIKWEAEQFIPLPLTKMRLDYTTIETNTTTQKMKLLLVAAPISVVEKYMRIIDMAGLKAMALETEILADNRIILETFPSLSNILIINFGAKSTEIGLIHERIFVFTKSYPVGGNTLTSAIADELGFEPAQAEEYKKTYGLLEDKLEGKISKILNPFMNSLYEEIEKIIIFFKEKYPKAELSNAIVCGGGARLPGLLISLTKNLGIDTQISNPFLNMAVDVNIKPVIEPDASLYNTAVGLAIKEI